MATLGSSARSVTTITPQRLSFAGGGTDISVVFKRDGGAVVSCTIDKYVYVTVKRHSPLFNENYRLSYSKTEHVNRLDDIENDIARECLRLVNIEPPLMISTAADLPAYSGLGSSSSFAVGLLYALHTLRGEDVAAGQLAEEACHIEIDVLGRPIGKQDQYAAAFGGLNYIEFRGDGRVQLDALWLPENGMTRLLKSSMLFWTGVQRDSGEILREQVQRVEETRDDLGKLKQLAWECRDLMLAGLSDIEQFGRLLDKGWRAKRGLASGITTSKIDSWYEQALAAGASGGKIAGAGGGGFLYLVVLPERQAAVRAALPEMVDIRVRYEPRGARILATVGE